MGLSSDISAVSKKRGMIHQTLNKLRSETQVFAQLEKNLQTSDHLQPLLQQQRDALVDLRRHSLHMLYLNILNLSGLVEALNEELARWKREQQLVTCGALFTRSLDDIQHWSESLVELEWDNYRQLKQIEPFLEDKTDVRVRESSVTLSYLSSKVNELLTSQVKSTFIIEKQPQQAIMTKTRFTFSVHSLVGSFLGPHAKSTKVKVTIISNGTKKSSGDIDNDTATLEYNQASRKLAATFK